MKTKYQRKEEKLMDMKKYKWVSFVLCLAMIFSGFGGVAYAVEDPTPDSESSVMSTSPDAITSEPGTILIDNTAPIASDQSITTEMNQPVDILLTGTDLNDDPLTFVIVDQPANGKLTGDGVNWMYTPLVDYTGEDTFTFKVNDGMHDSNLVTVSIQVDNFLKEMVFDPALESNSIQSMTDGVFYATSEVLPVTGESPNGKTRVYFIWFEGYDLYVAIIFDAKKPIEQITFDNKIDSPTTFPSTDVNTWTGELMTIDGRQYPVSDYPRQGSTSKWAVINLGQEVISGFFDLGINTGAGGFSTTIMVEIDSELQVYHQYDGDEPLLDGTQSGFLTGPVGEYYTFDVYPVSKAGFNLQSIQIRINGGSLSTLTTSALIGGHLIGTVPAISGPEKAEITFIYVGIGEALNITSYSGIYDSEEHSIIVNNTITGDAIWYSLTDNGLDWSLTQPMFTDVTGAITVYVKVTNPNYIDRTGSGTVTITEREITITAVSDSKPYDGAALTKNSWTLTIGTVATGEAISAVTVTGSQTPVGTSANVPSAAVVSDGAVNVTANYNIGYVNGTLTVTAVTGEALNITSYSGIYDSEEHSIIVNNTITGDAIWYSLTDNGLDWSLTQPMFTDVTGATTVYVKVTNDNYIDLTGDETVTITARPITITAVSDSKPYDGAALTKNSWTLTIGTVATGEAISAVTVTGSQTPVGTSANVPSAAVVSDGAVNVTANYNIGYVNGTLTVTAVTGEALNITSYSGIYDSEEHSIIVNNTITGDAIWYSLTDNGLDWSLTQPMFTDVTGATTVYVKVTNDNYIDRTGDETVTITARPNTITAVSDSKPYDGAALTKNSWTLTIGTVVTGEAISAVTVTGSQTPVGTSANVPSAAVIEEGTENVVGNYDISYMPGTLTVTASTGAALDITSYSGIYDGAGHSITVNNAITGDTVTYSTDGGVTYTGTNPAYTNVGSYMVDVKVTNPNYIDITGSGTVEITERAITITPADASTPYDGTALTTTGWAMTS